MDKANEQKWTARTHGQGLDCPLLNGHRSRNDDATQCSSRARGIVLNGDTLRQMCHKLGLRSLASSLQQPEYDGVLFLEIIERFEECHGCLLCHSIWGSQDWASLNDGWLRGVRGYSPSVRPRDILHVDCRTLQYSLGERKPYHLSVWCVNLKPGRALRHGRHDDG